MLESKVEERLVRGVKRLGGMCLKWVSPGCTGVPDRIVVLPGGRVIFVELKQPAGRKSVRQKLVGWKLMTLEADVRCLWNPEEVDEFLREVGGHG